MSLKLHTIICSTRPTRLGPKIAQWFDAIAQGHDGFDAELVDLASFNLPVFDEPKHPRLRDYAHDHTKAWSKSIDAADAFVFVTPEYNYGPPPSFTNAVNYLVQEWAYKPAAFISYGGASGGLRAVQMEKLLLTSVKVMPIPEGVALPMFSQHLTDAGFQPPELQDKAAGAMLSELARWAAVLKTLRAPS
ncbi:MAG: NAD(P)H-dependent oxidoreductase [Phenylobacterium sp.]|uniref:NADPH-dependent FMN reductase n=1 Tax=Phenylobacterium sp. TaxID=1871053 RepID=UPI003BB4A625